MKKKKLEGLDVELKGWEEQGSSFSCKTKEPVFTGLATHIELSVRVCVTVKCSV